MLALLYLMAHIDRANIGNAKIEGMIKDLGMTGVQYNLVLAICEYQFMPFLPFLVVTNNFCSSLRTLCLVRGTQQCTSQEVQTPFNVSRYSRLKLGHNHDLYRFGQEFCWFDGCQNLVGHL